MGYATVLLALPLIFILTATSTAQTYKCTTPATCNALIDYITPNSTNISSIKTLFGVKNHRSILGANNYNLSTSPNYTVPANQKIKIPFPCVCSNGTGISNKRPIYTVQKDDGLYHIAADVFSGLVKFQKIAEVNNISNPDLIEVGQKLWIPLPCSCDEVDGVKVVHYGYLVETGNSVASIAQEFNVTEETLLTLNGMTDPKTLQAGAVLDVPLKACTSMIANNSLDYPLLVANDTYVFTANNCVKCKCDSSSNWALQCEPSSQFKPTNWSTCPSMQCQGTESLYIGNSTSAACNLTTCTYAGYTSQTILTTLATESTCPASGNNNAPGFGLRGCSWNLLLISVQLAMLCLHLFG